jgi:hypothetical protein
VHPVSWLYTRAIYSLHVIQHVYVTVTWDRDYSLYSPPILLLYFISFSSPEVYSIMSMIELHTLCGSLLCLLLQIYVLNDIYIFGQHRSTQGIHFVVTTGSRVFTESNSLRWELNLELSAKISLFSAKKKLSAKNFFAESKKKKYSQQRILHREQDVWLSAKKFKKITFSPSIFFYHQHALIQRICSNLTQIYVCLLYLKILLHSRKFYRRRMIWTASAWNHRVNLLEKWDSCSWDISKTMYTK